MIFNVVGKGVTGMYDITVISIIVACIVSLVREYGGIQIILKLIKSRIRGKRGGEFGIAVLALFVDLCTAKNTIAIVMAGPIAKENSLKLIKSRIRGKRGGEFGIAVLALFVDLCTAKNTIAIVMAGPIAKENSE